MAATLAESQRPEFRFQVPMSFPTMGYEDGQITAGDWTASLAKKDRFSESVSKNQLEHMMLSCGGLHMYLLHISLGELYSSV